MTAALARRLRRIEAARSIERSNRIQYMTDEELDQEIARLTSLLDKIEQGTPYIGADVGSAWKS